MREVQALQGTSGHRAAGRSGEVLVHEHRIGAS